MDDRSSWFSAREDSETLAHSTLFTSWRRFGAMVFDFSRTEGPGLSGSATLRNVLLDAAPRSSSLMYAAWK